MFISKYWTLNKMQYLSESDENVLIIFACLDTDAKLLLYTLCGLLYGLTSHLSNSPSLYFKAIMKLGCVANESLTNTLMWSSSENILSWSIPPISLVISWIDPSQTLYSNLIHIVHTFIRPMPNANLFWLYFFWLRESRWYFVPRCGWFLPWLVLPLADR